MQLTEEQRHIVEHPTGRHGRVLAVAGSGKTTTMAFWLARLIGNGVEPRRIQVLMFNRLARLQFRNSLNGQNLDPSQHPHVHTLSWLCLASVERST